MGNTNWISWIIFFKEDKKNERGKDVGLNLRGAGSGMGI